MIDSAIATFFGYFRQEADALDTFERKQYRKILICVFLDTLAKAMFPKIDGNRERFTKHLRECTSWEHWSRIATFQLHYRLQATGNAPSELSEQIDSLIRRHPQYSVIRVTSEPTIDDILPYARTNEERRLVEQSTYLSLFYLLRNYLVHEGREPGGAYEFEEDTDPVYMTFTRTDDDSRDIESKELLFPYKFMKMLLLECIDHSQSYFSDLNVDPRTRFSMTSVW